MKQYCSRKPNAMDAQACMQKKTKQAVPKPQIVREYTLSVYPKRYDTRKWHSLKKKRQKKCYTTGAVMTGQEKSSKILTQTNMNTPMKIINSIKCIRVKGMVLLQLFHRPGAGSTDFKCDT